MVHRLVYTDDNSNQQVIGRLSSSETGSVFNKARRKIQDKNYSKLNIWGDSTLYGNLPVSTSNFESGNVNSRTEPYVLWQENTGTQASPNWVNRFRGFIDSQGVITDNGDVKFTVFSLEKYLGQQKVTLDPSSNSNLVNTDIVTVLQEMIPSGYTVDFPGDVTIPSVDRYSLNTKRGVGFRDLTRDYGWNLVWPPEIDGNGDWVIRFEPDGYGGTVDDIYSSASATYTNNIPDQTLGRFNEWSKERTKDIINSAQVIGSDSNGNTILSDVKQDSSSINDYGEKFERKQVGYLESKSEADSLAQDIVDNNSSPVEGGRVDASPRYRSIVVNDSFNLKDASRNIDAVYTCNVQKDFYPEDKSYLFFNFEKDTEKRAAEKENLRSERDKIIGSTNQDVGNQDFTGDTGSAPSDTNVAGSLDTDVTGQNLASATVVIPAGYANSSLNFALQVPDILNRGGTTKFFDGIQVTITVNNFDIDSVDWQYDILESGGSTVASGGVFTSNEDQTTTVQDFVEAPDVTEGENIDILLDAVNSTLFESPDSTEQINAGAPFGLTTVEVKVQSTEFHEHNDSYDTNDNSHGGSGDATGQHGTSGTTDSKNVEIAQEEETDR